MAISYLRHFKLLSKSHPVVSLTITNSGLAAVADLLGQTVSHTLANPGMSFVQCFETVSFDARRLTRFVFYQGAVAPVVFKWFSFLDRKFPISFQSPVLPKYGSASYSSASYSEKNPRLLPDIRHKFQTLYKPVLKRVLVDQILFAPFSLAVFFICITLLEGGKFEEVKAKFQETYWTALVSNWKLWPIVQMVNFCYIPLFFRLPFAGVVGIFWNTYLSFINGHKTFYNASDKPSLAEASYQ